jgi:hypothetical protein
VKDEKGLERLIKLARRRRTPRQQREAPFGFSTRVASRALSVRREDGLLVWERLAAWGVAMAIVVCVLTTALHQRSPEHSMLAEFAGVNESSESFW